MSSVDAGQRSLVQLFFSALDETKEPTTTLFDAREPLWTELSTITRGRLCVAINPISEKTTDIIHALDKSAWDRCYVPPIPGYATDELINAYFMLVNKWTARTTPAKRCSF